MYLCIYNSGCESDVNTPLLHRARVREGSHAFSQPEDACHHKNSVNCFIHSQGICLGMP